MFSNSIVRAVIVTSAFIVAATGISMAGSLDKVQFIKVAPQDAKAVIRTAHGKLEVIKAGDAIDEAVTVKAIAPNRIVLEEKTDKGLETIIVRMLNGKSSVERLRKLPDRGQQMVAPAVAPDQK